MSLPQKAKATPASEEAQSETPAAAPPDNGRASRPWHPVLRQQLEQHFGHLNAAPPELKAFLEAVNETYHQADTEQAALTQHVADSARELLQTDAALTALNDITRASLETSDLGALLQLLADRLGALFEADACYITLWDEARRLPTSAATYGPWRPDYPNVKPQVDQANLTTSVLAARRALVVEDALHSPYLDAHSAREFQAQAILALPLIAHDERLGAALIVYHQPHSFDAEQVLLGERVAGQAALAVAKVRALDRERQQLEAVRRQAAELEVLRQANLNLTSSLELSEVLDAILGSAIQIWPEAQDAHIFLYDGARLTFGAALWADGRTGQPHNEPRSNGLTYTVARSGQPLVIPDMRRQPLTAQWEGAIVGLPLKIGPRVVGVMNLAFPRPHDFSESELRILRSLGDQAAIAIENARLFEATRRQLQELTALHAVAAAGTEATNEDALIERVTELIGVTLYPTNFGCLLVDESTGNLRVHPSYRDALNPHKPTLIPSGQGIAWQVIATGQPQRVGDVTQSPTYWAGSPHTRSELCVPLRVGGRIIGVMNAESDGLHAFAEADERLLVTLAGQLATAIEKVRLFEAEREQRVRAETLREVAATLNAVLDRERLLQIILQQLARVVSYDSAAVMLVEGDQLAIVAHHGFQTEAQLHAPFEIRRLEHVQQVLVSRRPVIIANTLADPRWQPLSGAEYIRCWLGVPLIVEEQVIGLVNLDWETPGFYTERHAELAAAFANQAAVAIERLRLLEETRRREREMATLLNVARIVSSTLDVDELMSQVAVAVAQALNVDRCTLATYDANQRAIIHRAIYDASGQRERTPLGVACPLDNFPAVERVIDQDEVLLVRVADPEGDPAERGLLRRLGFAAELMFPVRAGGRVVGVAELYSAEAAREFTSDDVRLARALADQVGVALDNARLFQAERSQRELAEALREVGTILNATLDFDTLLDRLLDQVTRLVPCDAANVLVVTQRRSSPSEGSPRAHFARWRGYERFGQSALELKTLSFDLATTAHLRYLAETSQPLIIADTSTYPGWIRTEASTYLRSWAGAPIILQGEGVAAFFALEKIEPKFYQPEHAERLKAFAAQAALALQNARLFAAQQQRAVELEAVRQTSLSLTSSLELSVVLEAILKGAFQLTQDARDAYIFLYYADDRRAPSGGGERLTFGAMRWHDGRTQQTWAEPRPEGMTYTVARTGEMIVVPDTRGHPLFTNSPADWGEAMLGLPLKIGQRVVGVMNIAYLHRREFPESELRALGLLADQAAIAIENARLFEESRRQTQELTGLYDVALAMGSVLDTEVLLARLHEQIRQLLTPDTFAVVLYHPATQAIETALVVEHGQRLPQVRLPFGQGGFSAWVINTRQPLLVGDVQVTPLPVETQHLAHPARSWLGAPLIAHDRVLGVVSVQSARRHAFSEADRRFLESIAGQFAVALENAQLYAQTERRLAEQTVLYECGQDLLAARNMETAVAIVSERMVRYLKATAMCYYIYDEASHTAQTTYEYFTPEASEQERQSVIGQSWDVSDYPKTAHALRTRTPCVMRLSELDLAPAERESLLGWGGQTVTIIPVAIHDRTLGYFEIWDSRAERQYEEADLRLLMALAAQSAITLENVRLYAEVDARAAELGRLYAAAQDLSASLELNVVLELLAKHLTEALDATSGRVLEVNPEEETLTVRAEYWHETASAAERVSDVGRVYYIPDYPTISQALTWGDVISFNVDSPGLTEPERAQLLESGVQAALVVPITFRGRVLGEVEIWESRRARNFTLAEHRLAQTLVQQAAGIIENAQLFKALADEKRRLELLYNLGQSLTTSLDPREVALKAVDQICAAFGAPKGAVFVLQPDGARLKLLATTGADPAQVELFDRQINLEVGRGSAGWAAAQRKPVIAVDVTRDPHWVPTPGFDDWVQSCINIPLIAGDALVGVFALHSDRRSAFHAGQLPLLVAATTSVAAALQNARLYEAEARRVRDLALLNEITRAAIETTSLREMLQKLADRLGELLNADACYITLWDAQRQLPIPAAAVGPQRETYPTLRPAPGEVTLTGSALRLGHTLVVDDVFHSPYLSQRAAQLSGAQAMLALPLVTSEQKLGAAIIAFHEPHPFTPEEIGRAEQAAGQIALGIERNRLFAETAEALVREQRLNEIARAISGALDVQTISQNVVRLAAELVGADAGSLAIVAPGEEALLWPYFFNAPAELTSAEPVPRGSGLAWQIIETGRPILLDDYASHPDARPEWVRVGARGFIGVPVAAGEVSLGVLGLFSLNADRRFNERDVALVESVGRQAGVAVQNARLFESARRHADEVTAASDVLRALNAAAEVGQAFPTVVAGVQAITGCDRVSLALVDDSREYFNIVAVEAGVELNLGSRVRLADTSITPDILAGQPHLTPDLAAEQDLPLEHTIFQAGYRSRLNLPLRVADRITGVLSLVWSRLKGYDLAHLPLLGPIANAIALAVEKERLFAETRRRAYELEILAEVSTALRVAGSTFDIMEITLARGLTIFRAEHGAIAVPGPAPEILDVAYERGWPFPMRDYVLPVGSSIVGHVFTTGQPYLVSDWLNHPQTPPAFRAAWSAARPEAGRGSVTALFAPLRAGQEVIGVIFVADELPRVFTEDDLRLLNAVAEIAGSALHRAGVLETLEQRVAERTRELAEANERLTELDRLRDQFVSNVSHELRTPLTNIKLHLGLLERRGPEVMDRYMPILQRETERLRKLIEDLLDISRLRAQIAVLKREPLRLDSLLTDIVAIHATRAESKHVTLRHEANPALPEVLADRAQLIQVFTNLISNAVAYTPPGGRVAITSFLEPRRDWPGAVIRFNNTGPVIPTEDLQHVFERFYRGKTGLDSGEPGTGLGLFICKEIVERHDGQIQAQSREGEGTTFTVWLPLK